MCETQMKGERER